MYTVDTIGSRQGRGYRPDHQPRRRQRRRRQWQDRRGPVPDRL